MKTITVKEFAEGLRQLKSPSKITISATTVPRMKKKGNQFLGRVHKDIVAQGQIGAKQEDDYEHSWAEEVGQCFVEGQNGEIYIRFTEFSRTEQFLLDDKPIPKSVVQEFLQERGEDNGYRNYNIKHINSFIWKGETYRIVPGE